MTTNSRSASAILACAGVEAFPRGRQLEQPRIVKRRPGQQGPDVAGKVGQQGLVRLGHRYPQFWHRRGSRPEALEPMPADASAITVQDRASRRTRVTRDLAEVVVVAVADGAAQGPHDVSGIVVGSLAMVLINGATAAGDRPRALAISFGVRPRWRSSRTRSINSGLLMVGILPLTTVPCGMTRSALRARQSAPSTRGKSCVSAEAACENLHNTFPRKRHCQNEAKAPRRARQRTNSVGGIHPHRPATAGHGRLHLTQLVRQHNHQPFADRLRPLTCKESALDVKSGQRASWQVHGLC